MHITVQHNTHHCAAALWQHYQGDATHIKHGSDDNDAAPIGRSRHNAKCKWPFYATPMNNIDADTHKGLMTA